MDINKNNESYQVTDTTSDGWNVTGKVVTYVSGRTECNLNINSDTDSIGWYNITIPTEGKSNISLTVNPDYMDSVIDYTQTAWTTVKEYLANQVTPISTKE